jgi:hypothetical protein
MSEDQQQPPESVNSQPETPPTPETVEQSPTRLEQNQVQPFLKAQSIKALRGTIGLLETIVEKLEAEPVREIPPTVTPPATTPVLNTTTATPEQESASRVSVSASEASAADTPTVAPKPTAQELADRQLPSPTKPKLIDRILPSFRSLQAFWDATLAKVRSLLPAAWNEKLSDWGLTGAIAGIVVVLLVTTAALLPETPAQVAKAPPNTIEAPPELKAPEPPQPVEVETPPPPELTPEQSLIAGIQNQVAEITNRYGNGLIQSIEANFEASRLIVKVSDGWYDLKESQQNKLADEILRRSNELDFSKLQITDLKETLLARSPVVGSNMVILKRQDVAATL